MIGRSPAFAAPTPPVDREAERVAGALAALGVPLGKSRYHVAADLARPASSRQVSRSAQDVKIALHQALDGYRSPSRIAPDTGAPRCRTPPTRTRAAGDAVAGSLRGSICRLPLEIDRRIVIKVEEAALIIAEHHDERPDSTSP